MRSNTSLERTRSTSSAKLERRRARRSTQPLDLTEMSSRTSSQTPDPAKRLLGVWRSDRARTLAFWGFPKSMPSKLKSQFRSKDFFGHFEWHVTPKRIRFVHKGRSQSESYTVTWKGEDRVIIKIGGKSNPDVRDIHFDADDHFYMLAARANCEFFRRVRSNTSFERTRGR